MGSKPLRFHLISISPVYTFPLYIATIELIIWIGMGTFTTRQNRALPTRRVQVARDHVPLVRVEIQSYTSREDKSRTRIGLLPINSPHRSYRALFALFLIQLSVLRHFRRIDSVVEVRQIVVRQLVDRVDQIHHLRAFSRLGVTAIRRLHREENVLRTNQVQHIEVVCARKHLHLAGQQILRPGGLHVV